MELEHPFCLHYLYFGYLTDADPVSYDDDGEFVGYCKSLMDYINDQKVFNLPLKGALVRYPRRFQRYAEIVDDGKFKQVQTNKLIVECGPNTITSDREKDLRVINSDFSNHFYSTGAKLLIKKNEGIESSLFDQEIPLKGQTIAIIENTTTNNFIKQIYTRSSTIPVADDRREIAESIGNNIQDISIYASDEILLEELLRKRWDQLTNQGKINYYQRFFPKCRLSHEEYGIVVYDISREKNKQVLDLINKFIGNNKLEQWLSQNDEWNKMGKELDRGEVFLSSPKEVSDCLGNINDNVGKKP